MAVAVDDFISQEKVRKNYDSLMEGDGTWVSIDTDGLSLDQVW